jgi:hypothetical protein
MNRAWIPAGALAGVSVAGLIALGPLTSSLNTSVPFPTSVAVTAFGETSTKPVPVSVNYKQVGQTETAANPTNRGGAAAEPATDSTSGQVGYRRRVVVTTNTPAKTVVTPAKPKKPVKRASIIGTTGEANGDSGLAGGSSNTPSTGEQVPTPSSDR